MKNFINMNVTKIPMSAMLNYFWNFGFLLGFIMIIQIVTGFLITFTFIPTEKDSFNSIYYMQNEIYYGWFIYLLHSIGVSMIFILMYIHMFRSMYYKKYKNILMWINGMIMYLMLIIISFLGYSLPWNQMSYWAAKVITSLVSIIIYIGNDLVLMLWGDFTVSGPTLQRFFSLHFILPMILLIIMMSHIIILHNSGSNNPFGLDSKKYMISFFPYFSMKDLFFMLLLMLFFMYLLAFYPYFFMESDAFMKSNKLITPSHIKPDWFLLWVYCILRGVESKIGGVVCMALSFIILMTLPLMSNYYNNKMNIFIFYDFLFIMVMMSYCGGSVLEYPYTNLSTLSISLFYFYIIMLLPM